MASPLEPAAPPAPRTGRAPGVDRTWRIICAAAVVAPIVVALIAALGHPWFPAGDNAVIELLARDVPRHLPLFGVYSRYGFHHPGPALFLVYAVPARLLGPSGLLVGAAAVNATSVIGTSIFLFRRGGRPLLLLGTAALLVFEHAFAEQLLDPWNSWVAVLPFALAIVLAWSVWCHDWWALPVLAVTLSFAVQTHVGYALLAVWLFGGALVVALRHRPVRALGATAVALAVCWALPVWDQFRGAGNLGLIVDHFKGPGEAVVGWSAAAGVVAREMGITAPWLGGDEPVAPFTAGVVGSSLVTVVPVIVAFAAAAVLAWRARLTDVTRLHAVLAGTAVASYVSVARITGEPYPYLIRWLWVTAVALWLATAWSLWLLGRDRIVASLDGRQAPALVKIAGVVVAFLAMWASVATTDQPAPQPEFSKAIDALVDPVAQAAAGRGNLLVLSEGVSYQEVQSGLVPELERRGVAVMVRDEDAFKYGDHRKANGRRVDARLVVAVNEAVEARRAAGKTPIAEFDPLTAPERSEIDRLRGKYARQLEAMQRGETPADPMTPDDLARAAALTARGHLVAVYLDEGAFPTA